MPIASLGMFDGLDIGQSTQLANIMQDESRSMSMIISSHRMEVVERLADLIIVLRDGNIFTMGTVEQVCQDLCGSSVAVSNSPDQNMPHTEVMDLQHLLLILNNPY